MLSIVVQHHPSREDLILPLVEQLGVQVEVVVDPDPDGEPSPLRTYTECLARTPSGCGHRLVVQDDAWPVAGLPCRVEALIAERPDALIALCVQGTGGPGRTMRLAARAGQPWAQLRPGPWAPTVATVWPRDHALAFVAFARARFPVVWLSDDAPVADYVKHSGVEVWAPVPSLVQHPDVVPSLIPGRTARAGKNKARIAAVFTGD